MKEKFKDLICGLHFDDAERLYIWGAGNTSSLFIEGAKRIPQLKIEAFIDSDPKKQGGSLGGIPIIPASQMQCGDGTLVLISTGQPQAFKEIKKQLDGMGVQSGSVDAFVFSMFKDQLLKAYDSLEDESSREVYYKMAQCRINCTFPDQPPVTSEAYFSAPCFSMINERETFIDCGAFVGDSAERYIWAHDGIFKKIIAFEPDSKNFEALKYRTERLKREWNAENKIEILPYGIGDTDNMLYIKRYDHNNGLGSKMSENNSADSEECRIVTLAPYINDDCCFVKADIESYEYKMLTGAAEKIRVHKPKFAVCIYHNAVDFFSIPNLLKSLVPEYKLTVMQHSYTLSETVLYAHI